MKERAPSGLGREPTPYVRAHSTALGLCKYFPNPNRKMKRIKNKKMITYPVDGLLLVVAVGLGLEVEVGVGDVVVCVSVFVDQRYGR